MACTGLRALQPTAGPDLALCVHIVPRHVPGGWLLSPHPEAAAARALLVALCLAPLPGPSSSVSVRISYAPPSWHAGGGGGAAHRGRQLSGPIPYFKANLEHCRTYFLYSLPCVPPFLPPGPPPPPEDIEACKPRDHRNINVVVNQVGGRREGTCIKVVGLRREGDVCQGRVLSTCVHARCTKAGAAWWSSRRGSNGAVERVTRCLCIVACAYAGGAVLPRGGQRIGRQPLETVNAAAQSTPGTYGRRALAWAKSSRLFMHVSYCTPAGEPWSGA